MSQSSFGGQDTLVSKAEHPKLLRGVTALAGAIAFGSTVGVGIAALLAPAGTWPPAPQNWWLKVAVFAAVATVPHWFVEFLAWIAVALGEGLQPGDHKIGFRNPGAYLGMVERVLFLGALVMGYPEFIAAWFVLKGIAGYRVEGPDTKARRTFQLFLLNNAVSLAGVALGWLGWKLLGLPVWHR
jgi:hypothetical protein